MSARPLSIEQRAALAKLATRPLRATGRPDRAWRFQDLCGPDAFVAATDLEDLRERGLIRIEREIEREIVRLSPMGQEILARQQDAAARLAEVACRQHNAILCRRYRAARKRRPLN